MRLFIGTIVFFFYGCSHDLSAIPRDASSETALDAAQEVDPVADARVDGTNGDGSVDGPGDAGRGDAGPEDAGPEDAGPVLVPTYVLGNELSVHGAASVGDEIVVVGEGGRGADGPQAVVAVLGRRPRAIEYGGLGPDRLTDVAAFGDRVVMVGGVREGFAATQVDGLIVEMGGADLSTFSPRAVRYANVPQLLRAVALDDVGYVAVGNIGDTNSRGLVVVEDDPDRVYRVTLSSKSIVFHDVAITEDLIFAAGSSDAFGFLVAIERDTGVTRWTREVEINADGLTSYRGVAVGGEEVIAVGPSGFHSRFLVSDGGHRGTVGYGPIGWFSSVELFDSREWVVGLGAGDLMVGEWVAGSIRGWESLRTDRTILRDYWSAMTMSPGGPVMVVGGPGADTIETTMISIMALEAPEPCSTNMLEVGAGGGLSFMNRGAPAGTTALPIIDQDEELSAPTAMTLAARVTCD